MDDLEIDTLMDKLLEEPGAKVRAAYILADLTKLAPIYADEETRPVAEAVLAQYAEGDDALRKGMSMRWLAAARGALRSGHNAVNAAAGKASAAVGRVASPVVDAYKTVEGKVEAAGARAGAALAPHTSAAKDMSAVARGTKIAPTTATGKRMEASAGKAYNDTMAGAHANPETFRAHQEATRGGRGTASAEYAYDQSMMQHQNKARDASQFERNRAMNQHASRMAQHGRVAARHGFRAGLAAAGAGAVAVGGALSDKQHEQRVAAAHAQRHRGAQRMAGAV